MEHVRWVDRVFNFDFPVETSLELLERLRGTPARLEDRLRPLPRDLLVERDGTRWSVQEHAGHLINVEALFLGRLDDYDAGITPLRAADQSGGATYASDHNQSRLSAILARFREVRGTLVARLDALDRDGFAREALHPRLNRPMRVCDMMLFEAEHDDYHLARITELIARRGRV